MYSVTSHEVFRSGSVLRPRHLISEEVLLHLRSSGFTWTKIAQMLLVSRRTLRRLIVEYGLEEKTGFSMISDAQLDNLVERFMSDHGTLVGIFLDFRTSSIIRSQSSTGSNQGEQLTRLPWKLDRTCCRATIRYSSVIWMFALTPTSAVFQFRWRSCRRSRAGEKRSCQRNTCVWDLWSSTRPSFVRHFTFRN